MSYTIKTAAGVMDAARQVAAKRKQWFAPPPPVKPKLIPLSVAVCDPVPIEQIVDVSPLPPRQRPRLLPLLKHPTIKEIVDAVCQKFGVSEIDIRSDRRLGKIVTPRHVAFYLARTITPYSLPDIGRRFGGRDHTTVLHGVRHTEAMMAADPVLAATVAELKAQLLALVPPQEDY